MNLPFHNWGCNLISNSIISCIMQVNYQLFQGNNDLHDLIPMAQCNWHLIMIAFYLGNPSYIKSFYETLYSYD